jgi:hypothetical protein
VREIDPDAFEFSIFNDEPEFEALPAGETRPGTPTGGRFP